MGFSSARTPALRRALPAFEFCLVPRQWNWPLNAGRVVTASTALDVIHLAWHSKVKCSNECQLKIEYHWLHACCAVHEACMRLPACLMRDRNPRQHSKIK
jgi:hypothetical protein